MKQFTGFEYLLIDAANQMGMDKHTFDERIDWSMERIDELESFDSQAENVPLFIAARIAIDKARKGTPTGHLVGLDAISSGIQIMSVLTGCPKGAAATGLQDVGNRPDAYSVVTQTMNKLLNNPVAVGRAAAKQAVMTAFYGSTQIPQELLGKDTPEEKAFYESLNIVAPGAWELLEVLLDSWIPFTKHHDWVLPDGFDAVVRVMTPHETRVEVDELDHTTFTHVYYENEGQKFGLSNAANVVHSVDAYIVRTMQRRCNYDKGLISQFHKSIKTTLDMNGPNQENAGKLSPKAQKMLEHYHRSTVADISILNHMSLSDCSWLSGSHLRALLAIIEGMLKSDPFELVTVHDEFKAHPNNLNQVRALYLQILRELADSDLVTDLVNQVGKQSGFYKKKINNLSSLMVSAEYMLT